MTPIARLILLLPLTLVATGSVAQPCADYPLLDTSRLGALPLTRTNATFARAGDLVYASGYYPGLQVFDLAGPVQPALLADVDLPMSLSFGPAFVEPVGDLAYVGGVVYEIPVLDVADPAAPVEVARISTLFEVKALAGRDSLLYVATYGRRTFAGPDTSAFFVYDVTDPANALELTRIWDNHTWARSLALRGDVAFLGAGTGLHTLDVTDPTSVADLDQLDLGYPVEFMQFEGDLMYALAGGTLHVIDAADPAQLQPLGAIDTRCIYAAGLSVHDGLAVLAYRSSGLRIVDVSDPAQPSAVAAWMSAEPCYWVAAEAERVCVFQRTEAVVLAPEYPEPVSPLGAVELPYIPQRLTMAGGRLYTLNGTGLFIHGVGDPSAPELLGTFDQGKHYNRLAIDGSIVYLADLGDDGTIAVDVKDPTHPVRLSTLGTARSYSIHAANDRVVVGPRDGVVALYDTTDPADPILLGLDTADEPYRATGVALAGDHVYCLRGFVAVLDIGDPAHIHEVARLETGYGHDLVADGPWIYMANDDGLRVLRFTPPATLEPVAALPLPQRADDLHLDGDTLYLACLQGGVHVVDITDPAQPAHVGAIPPYHDTHAVAAADGVVALYSRSGYSNPQASVELYPVPCAVTAVEDAGRPPRILLDLVAAPNPFNPRVSFSFDLPRAGMVRLAVFDLRGRQVADLHRGHLDAGPQRFTWSGLDRRGRTASSGAYVARLQAGGATVARPVMLVR